jgi:hypothetical protein
MGWAGLIVFALLWFKWFRTGFKFLWKRTDDPMHRLGVGIFFGVWGVFLQSLTEWVYRQTAILFTLHIVLGTLASLYYLKRRQAGQTQAARVTPDILRPEPQAA